MKKNKITSSKDDGPDSKTHARSASRDDGVLGKSRRKLRARQSSRNNLMQANDSDNFVLDDDTAKMKAIKADDDVINSTTLHRPKDENLDQIAEVEERESDIGEEKLDFIKSRRRRRNRDQALEAQPSASNSVKSA